MIKDYFKLVYSSLKNRKIRSWLTMVGIFIGIAAVVSLIGLGEGLRETIAGQFDFISTDVLTVQASGLQAGPPGSGAVNPLTEKMSDDIERLSGVEMTITRIIESAQITFEGESDFTFVASMPEDKKSKELQRIAQIYVDQGRMIKEKDKDSVVLGYNFGVGDRFDEEVRLRDTVRIEDKDFEVIGLLEKKGSFIIDNAILLTEETTQDLFETNETVSVILVKVAKGADIKRVKERVEDYMLDERDVDEGEEDFSVESPEQSLQTLNSTLFAVQLFVYIIASISIIVGGIGITNTMYTSILERTKEIGIMKSIGAKNSDIFLLFFLESGFLGAVGGLVGVIFGMGLAYAVAMAGSVALQTELLTVSINPLVIIGSLLFSFIIGTIAGILPAIRASKLKPVDALAYAK